MNPDAPMLALPAEAEVLRLLAAELDFTSRLEAAERDLAAALPQAGSALLDAFGSMIPADLAPMSARACVLRGEVETLSAAVSAAREARKAAIPAAYAERASMKRDEAAALRTEAAALDDEMRPHLDALEKISGAAYVPGPDPRFAQAMLSTPLRFGIDAAPTRGAELAARAAVLDAEADRLATAAPLSGGVATAATVAELIDNAQDPYVMGPSAPAIHAWAEATATAERAQWASERLSVRVPVDDDAWESEAKRWTLVWRREVIDPERSSLALPHDDRGHAAEAGIDIRDVREFDNR